MESPGNPGNLGAAVCDVCARPLPALAQPVRVGACEFPFNVHEDCLAAMGPMAEEISVMCAAAAPEEQPEGLLWLGSWEPLATAEPDSVESSS